MRRHSATPPAPASAILYGSQVMTVLKSAAVALAIVVGTSAVGGAQGYDKKTIEKMLADGAKKLA